MSVGCALRLPTFLLAAIWAVAAFRVQRGRLSNQSRVLASGQTTPSGPLDCLFGRPCGLVPDSPKYSFRANLTSPYIDQLVAEAPSPLHAGHAAAAEWGPRVVTHLNATRMERNGSLAAEWGDRDALNFIVELESSGGKCSGTCCICGRDGHKRVLTARHCGGLTFKEGGGKKGPDVMINIRHGGETIQHKGYFEKAHHAADLAVVRVEDPLPEGYNFNQVRFPLPDYPMPKPGSKLKIGGFGGHHTQLFVGEFTYQGPWSKNPQWMGEVEAVDKKAVTIGGDSGGPWFTEARGSSSRYSIWGVHSSGYDIAQQLSQFTFANMKWLARF